MPMPPKSVLLPFLRGSSIYIVRTTRTYLPMSVVEAHPAEDGRDDVRDFPRREDQRTACPLALCVREFAHAVQHAIDAISVEACACDLRLGRLQPGRARRQCDAS
jgi:hypothetical protein